jgi:hypothetical protein
MQQSGVVLWVVQVMRLLHRSRPPHQLNTPHGDGKSSFQKSPNSTYCAQASHYYNTTKSRDNSTVSDFTASFCWGDNFDGVAQAARWLGICRNTVSVLGLINHPLGLNRQLWAYR